MNLKEDEKPAGQLERQFRNFVTFERAFDDFNGDEGGSDLTVSRRCTCFPPEEVEFVWKKMPGARR